MSSSLDSSHLLYYRLAVGSIFLSVFSLILLLLSVPSLFSRSSFYHSDISIQSAKFKTSSDFLWDELMNIRGIIPERRKVTFFSRNKRESWNEGGFCKGCFTLACPMGPPGPPGSPGPDGDPGDAGSQGRAGDDGFDVLLEVEDETPCVICPAGPPGPRGAQGERGMPGHPGVSGGLGPDGLSGMDGPIGIPGPSGAPGPQGPLGPKGPEGDMAVAGVGIKGPQGPPGPQGMKGRPGPAGKTSNSPGEPGMPGPPGGIGQTGKHGPFGMEGPYGPPGDPGMPASYCPSDCGVQNILAEVFPQSVKALNPYAPPTGHIQSTQSYSENKISDTSSYSSQKRLFDYAEERRLRKKLMKRLMKMRRRKM